jgi:hypothetical protein
MRRRPSCPETSEKPIAAVDFEAKIWLPYSIIGEIAVNDHSLNIPRFVEPKITMLKKEDKLCS